MTQFTTAEIEKLYGQSRVGAVVHRDLVAIYVNDSYARMMGRRDAADFMRDPLLVQYIPSAFHDHAKELSGAFVRDVSFHGWKKVYNIRTDGTPVWLEISDETIKWEDSNAILTTAQMVENGMTAMQVDHLLGRSFIGVMVHRDMKALYVNDAFARLMGTRDANDFMRNPELTRFIPVERQAVAWQHVEDIMQGRREGERHRVCDNLDNGSKVWRDLTDDRILWHDGKPAILTTAHDAQAEVNMTDALVRAKNSLENAVSDVIRMVPSAVAMLDGDMKVRHYNREFKRLFATGFQAGDQSVPQFDVDVLAQIYQDMIDAGHDHADRRSLETPSGLLADVRTNRLEDGGMMVAAQDVTDHKRIEQQLGELAATDPLTGALNRRGFEAAVARLRDVRQMKGQSWKFGLIILDLDYFKAVNDGHGHACGDKLLQTVVAGLRTALRDDDLVVRMGGEEFAVLLPSATSKITVEIANRLTHMIREIRISGMKGKDITISASFGVTVGGQVAGVEIDLSKALLVADKALYRAKQEGRDRVVTDLPDC
ncbi:diguanylate cyclase [Thalassospira sp.]|uniref:sensor domain-containing diguanylate cyclase n=1 Tax=Thalassospira sp. TaxID=1912094 RepID=UPI0027347DC7|nr:diguanylate cyclase [Thalassospira sp.]MDP2698183.1 diguanylate cyclase [Thalassospira sp.]